MKNWIRKPIFLITFVVSFYVCFQFLGALSVLVIDVLDVEPQYWLLAIIAGLSVIPSYLFAKKVWDRTKNFKSSQGTYILTGAVTLGVTGFVLGFFGPMIFAPEANQGPLLGILITGPIGMALGAIGGTIFWEIKKRRGLVEKNSKN